MPPDKRSGPDTTPDRSRKDSDLAAEAKPTVAGRMPRGWFHRNPCCPCRLCTSRACFVFNPDGCHREIHICWRGCDGLPPALLRWAA